MPASTTAVGGYGTEGNGDNGGGGGSGGLLISACRRHLASAPHSSSGGSSGSSRRPSPGTGNKRRRPEVQGQGQGAAAAREASGSDSTDRPHCGNAAGSSRGDSPCGPFRALLTTDKDEPGSSSSSSSKNRKAAAAAGRGGRLLSSVAMDLAHSLAVRSSSGAVSASASSSLRCRGCGGSSAGDSNAAHQHQHRQGQHSQRRQCRCIDVVYILHDPAPSSADGIGGERGPGDQGEEDEDEELLGADLFPLRCRQIGSPSPAGADSDGIVLGNDNDNDNNQEGNNADGTPPLRPSPPWDEAALSRIQIRHVRDGADLVRYLATVPLLPPHQQPLRGIVLNDIGGFVLGKGTASATAIAAAGGGGGGGGSAQGVASGPSSLGPSYYTIDSSIALTQILSILGNTADYLERQRRKFVPSSAQKSAEEGFSLLVTMDGNAYSQLPPHTKPVLQNWLPILGTLRPSTKQSNDSNGWALDLKRDGWRLPRSALDGPMAYGGAAGCSIKQSTESVDGMPEILWSVK